MNLDLLPSVRSQRHRERWAKIDKWGTRICVWTIVILFAAWLGHSVAPKPAYPQIVKCRHV